MDMNIWVTCFLASWIFSLSPGAGSVFSMSNGLNHGFKNGFWGVIGLILGLWAVFLTVVVGLGVIIQASPIVFNIIKWAGVAYLFYLGVDQWRSKAAAVHINQSNRQSQARSFDLVSKGIALNLINPKGYIFMLAVIPQFINSSAPLATQYIVVAATFAFTDLVVMSGYTGLASKALSYLKTEGHVAMLNKVFGFLFMLAAIGLSTFQQVNS